MSEVVEVPTSTNGAIEGLNAGVSRRSFVGSAALIGMAVAVRSATASASEISGGIQMSKEISVKIRRARLSGPASLTKAATVAIPIGPHWMILWPFDAATYGLPSTLRDKGAWMMFADTPYAYLHICGSPWEGNGYQPDKPAIWTMSYDQS